MTKRKDGPGKAGRCDVVAGALEAHEIPRATDLGYRCVSASVAGFIQQVAVSYIRTGHFFYVSGTLPPDAVATTVDAKLIHKYGVHATRWARALRKARGEANLQYIRCDRFFVLMATHGRSLFFDLEGESVKDCRRQPIKFAGYSLSYRNAHPHVRIDLPTYLGFKASMAELALRMDRAGLEELLAIPRFVPYAPVRRQLLNVLREMNRVRGAAGLERLDEQCLPLRRSIVRPFGDDGLSDTSSGEEQPAVWGDASLPVATVPDCESDRVNADPSPRRPAGEPPEPRGEEAPSSPDASGQRPKGPVVSASWVFPDEWNQNAEPKSSTEGRPPESRDRPRGIER